MLCAWLSQYPHRPIPPDQSRGVGELGHTQSGFSDVRGRAFPTESETGGVHHLCVEHSTCPCSTNSAMPLWLEEIQPDGSVFAYVGRSVKIIGIEEHFLSPRCPSVGNFGPAPGKAAWIRAKHWCGRRDLNPHGPFKPCGFSYRLRLSPSGRGAFRKLTPGLRSGLSLHRSPKDAGA